MKSKLILYLIIVILLLTGTVGGFVIFNLNNQIERLSNNFKQVYTNMPDKDLMLTKQEFKQLNKQSEDKILAYVMDSLKLKYKHIRQTIDNNYEYSYDTTIVMTYDIKGSPIRYFSYQPDSCINVEGRMDFFTDTMIFDKFDIRYASKSVYYWNRETKNGRKIFWPFGKKINYCTTVNNCKGQTKTKKITINKK